MKNDYVSPKYEHPVDDINWTAGVGRPAGIYWLAGRSIIAGHGTAAEDHLIGQGAILIATLLFTPDPLERGHTGRIVDRVDARSRIINPLSDSPASTRPAAARTLRP